MRDATDLVTYLAQGAATPWDYDYFALLRRLEAIAGDTPRWGRALRPSAEPLRIGQEPSLSFPPAAFSAFDLAASPPRLRQQFFGYLGPNGPLPIHLSDFIRERALSRGDPTWLAFLDIFLHRFALHLYRAWAQARPAVGMDRPGEDRFRAQVGSLIGIGGPARQQRNTVHDDARLHFAGHLARRVHNAESVESVLRAYFAVPVRLEPWAGHWMRPDAAELTHLRTGAADRDRDAARRPGLGAMMGTRVWDRQHRVRLHIGPLPLARYLDFLPAGRERAPLRHWMQQLTGDELAWDTQLILHKTEVPPTRLGSRTGNAPRLGRVAWLGAQPRTRHAADVRIDHTQRQPPAGNAPSP
ncbi:MAG: type VI secretion system baseplate subunit TssG [Burkholderiaceae bacterium]|nr:type VI secretion system baseplate subunit TssG [Burkholderiaceae bacterium]